MAAATMYELIDTLAEAVGNDAEILAWSNTNYDQEHKIFTYGIDDRDAPEASNCPFVSIRPWEFERAGDKRERIDVVLIESVIYDDEISEAGGASLNVQSFTGGKNIVFFHELILSAVAGARLPGGSCSRLIGDVKGEYENTGIFPYFIHDKLIEIIQRVPMGVDPLL